MAHVFDVKYFLNFICINQLQIMKTIITTLLLAGFCLANVSCSVQEDATDTIANVNTISQGDKIFTDEAGFAKAFGEGLAEAIKNMDFVTLFKYTNENELKSESEGMIKFMLKEMPDEILRKENAAYMVITADVSNGRGTITGMYFLNSKKDMALEQYITNADNDYNQTDNVPFDIGAIKGYTLVQDGIRPNDAQLLSGYLADEVAKSGKTGSFMIISSADKASLYLKS